MPGRRMTTRRNTKSSRATGTRPSRNISASKATKQDIKELMHSSKYKPKKKKK